MTHKLIKTENYLLVVDDSWIEVGDYYWNKEYPSQVYKRHHYNTSSDYKKIIAHLPLNSSPILEGVDLLPPIEDDVEEAERVFTEVLDSETKQVYNKMLLDATEHGFIIGYKKGYNKAKEKYKYTDEDVIHLLHRTARKYFQEGREYKGHMAIAGDPLHGVRRELINMVQSLHQYPTEFELEMIPCDLIQYTLEDNIEPEFKPKTITTPQGVQWVGKYK